MTRGEENPFDTCKQGCASEITALPAGPAHPLPPARMLARLFQRRARRHDSAVRRQPWCRSEMAMALRLLSGEPAGRVHRRPCRHVRGSPRGLRARVGRVPMKRTEADFRAWREHQAWTAEKYRRFDQGERMPPDLAERSTNKFNPVIWNKPGSAPSDSWLPENEEMPLNPQPGDNLPNEVGRPRRLPPGRGTRCEMSSSIIAPRSAMSSPMMSVGGGNDRRLLMVTLAWCFGSWLPLARLVARG